MDEDLRPTPHRVNLSESAQYRAMQWIWQLAEELVKLNTGASDVVLRTAALAFLSECDAGFVSRETDAAFRRALGLDSGL
jgi:hypothetical protein